MQCKLCAAHHNSYFLSPNEAVMGLSATACCVQQVGCWPPLRDPVESSWSKRDQRGTAVMGGMECHARADEGLCCSQGQGCGMLHMPRRGSCARTTGCEPADTPCIKQAGDRVAADGGIHTIQLRSQAAARWDNSPLHVEKPEHEGIQKQAMRCWVWWTADGRGRAWQGRWAMRTFSTLPEDWGGSSPVYADGHRDTHQNRGRSNMMDRHPTIRFSSIYM